MKRIALTGFLILFYFSTISASAQAVETLNKPAFQTQTFLDPLLNIVTTNLAYKADGSDLNDYNKSILGAQLGVSFQAGVTPHFSIVPELYAIMKGGKLEPGNPIYGSSVTYRFYQVELPLLARFHAGRFHINAGPSIAYNIHGTQRSQLRTVSLDFNNSSLGFKRWEVSVQAGGGYTFHTRKRRITLDMRYQVGLTDVSSGREMYNRGFVISLHASKPWKTNPLAIN